jgi:hypothetical protein
MTRPIWISIVVFACSALLTGCLDDPKPQDAPLGNEANPADVQTAIDRVLTGISITNAKVGDCVTYEENYKVEVGDTVPTNLIKHKLMSINDSADVEVFNLFEDYFEFTGSGAIKDEAHRQLPLTLKKGARNAELSSLTSKMLAHPLAVGSNLCDGTVKDDGDGVKYDCLRYFNLGVDDLPETPPDAVMKKKDCGGMANCQMAGHHLSYDSVKFLQGAQVHRVLVRAHFSSDIPDLLFVRASDGSLSYTPASTHLCNTQLVAVGNSKYLVTFCSVLKDVQKAATTDACFPPTPN